MRQLIWFNLFISKLLTFSKSTKQETELIFSFSTNKRKHFSIYFNFLHFFDPIHSPSSPKSSRTHQEFLIFTSAFVICNYENLFVSIFQYFFPGFWTSYASTKWCSANAQFLRCTYERPDFCSPLWRGRRGRIFSI